MTTTAGNLAAGPPPATEDRGHPKRWRILAVLGAVAFMAQLDLFIVNIAVPAIGRSFGGSLDGLSWVLNAYAIVFAALLVPAGRLADHFGRRRFLLIGVAVFTLASAACAAAPSLAILVAARAVQAVGAAMIVPTSLGLLYPSFPKRQHATVVGIWAGVAAVAGSSGPPVGGLLVEASWRWIFLINVPIGLIGTVWGVWKLREIGVRQPARIDWIGNLTFAAGLSMVLVGVTSGIQPYGGSPMGWGNPMVIGLIAGGLVVLGLFAYWETRTKDPLFHLELFRIRAFTLGNIAGLLGAVARGGLQFMLIIWLQGIWLPLHGYDYTQTPLWAGIYMLPLTIGFLAAGPVAGILSDRYGARPFATGGMVLAALTFGLLVFLPADFSYPVFAAIIFFNGVAMGLFASPNTAGIMNSVPARYRGVASGIRVTFMNVGMPLSIGLFFSLMIVGLNSSVPSALYGGLVANGVPAALAQRLAGLPPISYLFASFLGYNPLQTLLGPALAQLPPADAARLTGQTFFPSLIAAPFQHALVLVLGFSVAASLVAAAASALRGGRFVHEEAEVIPLREAAES
jgi:EmrB/QacA subfamily drug resistance transporter